MIKIRAFRAIDDYDACQKFILGHQKVLENIGVKKVTSSKNEWAENPAIFTNKLTIDRSIVNKMGLAIGCRTKETDKNK